VPDDQACRVLQVQAADEPNLFGKGSEGGVQPVDVVKVHRWIVRGDAVFNEMEQPSRGCREL